MLIQKIFNWEPATKLRDRLELTYRWIYDQMTKGFEGEPQELHLHLRMIVCP